MTKCKLCWKKKIVDHLCIIYYQFVPVYIFFQLTADDYSSMGELLPHLEQISQQHPEAVIQELASDLRATIATHGAYCPKTVPKTAPLHRTAHSPAQRAGHSSNSLPACTQSSRVPFRQQDPSQPVSHPKHTTDSGVTPKVNDIQTTGGIPNYGISEPSSSKAFSECLLEACDPDVPTRAVALRSLTRSVRDGNKEAMKNKDKLQTVSETVYVYIYILYYTYIHILL